MSDPALRKDQEPAPPRRSVRPEAKEGLALVGKSLLVVVGGVVTSAAAVDLVVDGFSARGLAYLAVGLALAGAPLALAFRDAARAGRER